MSPQSSSADYFLVLPVTFLRLLQHNHVHTLPRRFMTTLTNMDIKELDEEDLARKAATDVDAFAELYRQHVTRVYRYHMAHIGNVKDAEDLTSQTFVAAMENIRSYRGEGSFAAGVMGIASKKRLMIFRENRHEVSLYTV